jgi:hypothetical protein
MSERDSGVGSFLLGLGIGALLGFLLTPELGETTRTKLARNLRGLRDLAAEKAGEIGELLVAADEEPEEAAPRAALERRLTEAKRRRRGTAGPRGARALPPAAGVDEEDEPVA